MPDQDEREIIASWRFSILGPIFARPPLRGGLGPALLHLAEQTYTHPITKEPCKFSARTLEAWYSRIRRGPINPVDSLRNRRRSDANRRPSITESLATRLRELRTSHPDWTAQLIYTELKNLLAYENSAEIVPSYCTVRRWMNENDLGRKRLRDDAVQPPTKEVRRFEAESNDELWHLDFHHGDVNIPRKDGSMIRPKMLCVLDDRSRFVCHAQWYAHETAETLIHALKQALQMCGLPRKILMDNGPQMLSAEVKEGLHRLGIQQVMTKVKSPYQNGKQERFFKTMNDSFMPLLKHEEELTLGFLNRVTVTWIKSDYNNTPHRETERTPNERYHNDRSVARHAPSMEELRVAFTRQVTRKVHHTTGTVSLLGKRFELPIAHRHYREVRVRYASFDLSRAWLVDPRDNQHRTVIYPEDTVGNSDGIRLPLVPSAPKHAQPVSRPQTLQDLIDAADDPFAPPAYFELEEEE